MDRISLAAMCVEALACCFVAGFIAATLVSGYGYLTARPLAPQYAYSSPRKGGK